MKKMHNLSVVHRQKIPLKMMTLQWLVLGLVLVPSMSQWISYGPRGPRTDGSLWRPNMPAPRILRQSYSPPQKSSNSLGGNQYNSRVGSREAGSFPPPNNQQQQPRYRINLNAPQPSTNKQQLDHRQGAPYSNNNNNNNNGRNNGPLPPPPQQQQRPQSNNNNNNNNGQPWGNGRGNMQPKNDGAGSRPPPPSGNWQQGPTRNDRTGGRVVIGANVRDPRVESRPVSQHAGQLHDSWPNSNTHHHLAPVVKPLQKTGRPSPNAPSTNNKSPWPNVRVSNTPVQINSHPPHPSPSSASIPVSRSNEDVGTSAGGPTSPQQQGRDRMLSVTNTLSTLAKLSPKKPIVVFMRQEGISATRAGADPAEVVKKFAGSSKIPFFNGTLPFNNLPSVFLGPDDMTAPNGFGKIPIPNLKDSRLSSSSSGSGSPSRTGQQFLGPATMAPPPGYTKVLLPSSPGANSKLSQGQAQQATQSQNTKTLNNLSTDEKLKIIQMLRSGQTKIVGSLVGSPRDKQQQQQKNNPHHTNFKLASPSSRPENDQPDHRSILSSVLPNGAIIEAITPDNRNNGRMPGQGDLQHSASNINSVRGNTNSINDFSSGLLPPARPPHQVQFPGPGLPPLPQQQQQQQNQQNQRPNEQQQNQRRNEGPQQEMQKKSFKQNIHVEMPKIQDGGLSNSELQKIIGAIVETDVKQKSGNQKTGSKPTISFNFEQGGNDNNNNNRPNQMNQNQGGMMNRPMPNNNNDNNNNNNNNNQGMNRPLPTIDITTPPPTQFPQNQMMMNNQGQFSPLTPLQQQQFPNNNFVVPSGPPQLGNFPQQNPTMMQPNMNNNFQPPPQQQQVVLPNGQIVMQNKPQFQQQPNGFIQQQQQQNQQGFPQMQNLQQQQQRLPNGMIPQQQNQGGVPQVNNQQNRLPQVHLPQGFSFNQGQQQQQGQMINKPVQNMPNQIIQGQGLPPTQSTVQPTPQGQFQNVQNIGQMGNNQGFPQGPVQGFQPNGQLAQGSQANMQQVPSPFPPQIPQQQQQFPMPQGPIQQQLPIQGGSQGSMLQNPMLQGAPQMQMQGVPQMMQPQQQNGFPIQNQGMLQGQQQQQGQFMQFPQQQQQPHLQPQLPSNQPQMMINQQQVPTQMVPQQQQQQQQPNNQQQQQQPNNQQQQQVNNNNNKNNNGAKPDSHSDETAEVLMPSPPPPSGATITKVPVTPISLGQKIKHFKNRFPGKFPNPLKTALAFLGIQSTPKPELIVGKPLGPPPKQGKNNMRHKNRPTTKKPKRPPPSSTKTPQEKEREREPAEPETPDNDQEEEEDSASSESQVHEVSVEHPSSSPSIQSRQHKVRPGQQSQQQSESNVQPSSKVGKLGQQVKSSEVERLHPGLKLNGNNPTIVITGDGHNIPDINNIINSLQKLEENRDDDSRKGHPVQIGPSQRPPSPTQHSSHRPTISPFGPLKALHIQSQSTPKPGLPQQFIFGNRPNIIIGGGPSTPQPPIILSSTGRPGIFQQSSASPSPVAFLSSTPFPHRLVPGGPGGALVAVSSTPRPPPQIVIQNSNPTNRPPPVFTLSSPAPGQHPPQQQSSQTPQQFIIHSPTGAPRLVTIGPSNSVNAQALHNQAVQNVIAQFSGLRPTAGGPILINPSTSPRPPLVVTPRLVLNHYNKNPPILQPQPGSNFNQIPAVNSHTASLSTSVPVTSSKEEVPPTPSVAVWSTPESKLVESKETKNEYYKVSKETGDRKESQEEKVLKFLRASAELASNSQQQQQYEGSNGQNQEIYKIHGHSHENPNYEKYSLTPSASSGSSEAGKVSFEIPQQQQGGSSVTSFGGLLKTKMKFDKLKEQLYHQNHLTLTPPNNTATIFTYVSPVEIQPPGPPTFSPSPLPSYPTGSQEQSTTQQTSTTPIDPNGRHKIRPGDLSKADAMTPVSSITPASVDPNLLYQQQQEQYHQQLQHEQQQHLLSYGISPSGQPILIQSSSPDPSVTPHIQTTTTYHQHRVPETSQEKLLFLPSSMSTITGDQDGNMKEERLIFFPSSTPVPPSLLPLQPIPVDFEKSFPQLKNQLTEKGQEEFRIIEESGETQPPPSPTTTTTTTTRGSSTTSSQGTSTTFGTTKTTAPTSTSTTSGTTATTTTTGSTASPSTTSTREASPSTSIQTTAETFRVTKTSSVSSSSSQYPPSDAVTWRPNNSKEHSETERVVTWRPTKNPIPTLPPYPGSSQQQQQHLEDGIPMSDYGNRIRVPDVAAGMLHAMTVGLTAQGNNIRPTSWTDRSHMSPKDIGASVLYAMANGSPVPPYQTQQQQHSLNGQGPTRPAPPQIQLSPLNTQGPYTLTSPHQMYQHYQPYILHHQRTPIGPTAEGPQLMNYYPYSNWRNPGLQGPPGIETGGQVYSNQHQGQLLQEPSLSQGVPQQQLVVPSQQEYDNGQISENTDEVSGSGSSTTSNPSSLVDDRPRYKNTYRITQSQDSSNGKKAIPIYVQKPRQNHRLQVKPTNPSKIPTFSNNGGQSTEEYEDEMKEEPIVVNVEQQQQQQQQEIQKETNDDTNVQRNTEEVIDGQDLRGKVRQNGQQRHRIIRIKNSREKIIGGGDIIEDQSSGDKPKFPRRYLRRKRPTTTETSVTSSTTTQSSFYDETEEVLDDRKTELKKKPVITGDKSKVRYQVVTRDYELETEEEKEKVKSREEGESQVIDPQRRRRKRPTTTTTVKPRDEEDERKSDQEVASAEYHAHGYRGRPSSQQPESYVNKEIFMVSGEESEDEQENQPKKPEYISIEAEERPVQRPSSNSDSPPPTSRSKPNYKQSQEIRERPTIINAKSVVKKTGPGNSNKNNNNEDDEYSHRQGSTSTTHRKTDPTTTTTLETSPSTTSQTTTTTTTTTQKPTTTTTEPSTTSSSTTTLKKINPTKQTVATTTSKKVTTTSKVKDDDYYSDSSVEIRQMLKKLQARLQTRDKDYYDLGDDYYDDLEEETTNSKSKTKPTAQTTTTTTTKKPKKTTKSKNNKSKAKTSTKSKASSTTTSSSKGRTTTTKIPVVKVNSVPKKVVSTTPKPKPTSTTTKRTTVTTPKTTTTISSTTTTTTVPPPTTTKVTSTVPAETVQTTQFAQGGHPGQYYSSHPHYGTDHTYPNIRPTYASQPSSMNLDQSYTDVSYVFPAQGSGEPGPSGSGQFLPQSQEMNGRIKVRRRPLWVRRKPMSNEATVETGGSSAGIPPPSSGFPNKRKVVKLIRRRKPLDGTNNGEQRRPVFVQQSSETQEQIVSSSSGQPTISNTNSPVSIPTVNPIVVPTIHHNHHNNGILSFSTTTVLPIENLFDQSNFARRVGLPDSSYEKSSYPSADSSQQQGQVRRKLKLVRKGTRAQWKLKLNDDEPPSSFNVGLNYGRGVPRVASLVAPNPHYTSAGESSPEIDNHRRDGKMTPQVRVVSSTSMETRVCIQGQCSNVANK